MNAGDVYCVPYPFVRCRAFVYDEEGGSEIDSWKPGTIGRCLGYDDAENIAHGMGTMTLTVVSAHKPGKYPTRVFFVRQWMNPDGETFGKTNLRMTTMAAFVRRTKSYMHPFRVAEPEEGEIA